MEKDTINKKIEKSQYQRQFWKLFAAFFTILVIYTIIDDPMGVLNGILDSLK